MTTKAIETNPTKARKTKHLRHEFDPAETNWAALTFPADPYGLTAKVRTEFRAVVNRCRGSDEKFQQLVDNLKVLTAWGEAKLKADQQANAKAAEMAMARAKEDQRREEFRSRIQAGPRLRVSATADGFIETSLRDGTILAVYNTAEDARGPVRAMAQEMIAEGRAPNSTLEIDAFGRPGLGSGETLAELAGASNGPKKSAQPGGLQGIKD